jgi:hypothetical protein
MLFIFLTAGMRTSTRFLNKALIKPQGCVDKNDKHRHPNDGTVIAEKTSCIDPNLTFGKILSYYLNFISIYYIIGERLIAI